MIARLERNVHGRGGKIARPETATLRITQSHNFRVRTTAHMVKAFAQRLLVANDDGADRRVRRNVADTASRKFIGPR
jgi:hypothetical protein